MGKQREDYTCNMWIQVFQLCLFALVIAADRESVLTCHLDIYNSSGGRIRTVKKTLTNPIRLYAQENNFKLICRYSLLDENAKNCQFRWKNRDLKSPILSNFSALGTTSVSCEVHCGNFRCDISASLHFMKPTMLAMAKAHGTANLKAVRNLATSTEKNFQKNLMTSSNHPETADYGDRNLIVLLCLFGIIIVILSCLAGNASYLAKKCRSSSPVPRDTIDRHDEMISRERDSSWPMVHTTPAQQNYVNSLTTTRSCIFPNNALTNIEQTRSRSCCDQSMFSISNSSRQGVPLPPVPPPKLERRMSSSDGCIYHRTTSIFQSSCVEHMQTENREYKLPPFTTQDSFGDEVLYNTPYDITPSPSASKVHSDETTCRARLESEFTFGRDRFLSNALKTRPSRKNDYRRLTSQFSYHRDRFLSNAVKNVAFDGGKRDTTRPGTPLFSVTHRYTRSFSRFSLSTLEDVFINENVYETIPLDDLKSMSSGDLLLERQNKCLSNDNKITEESFPVYAKSEKASGKQKEGNGNANTSQRKRKELPSLYITLEQLSQHQRRCSLPSPNEVANGHHGEPDYVSHRLANLLASSSFRSEGHISPSSSKRNPFEISKTNIQR